MREPPESDPKGRRGRASLEDSERRGAGGRGRGGDADGKRLGGESSRAACALAQRLARYRRPNGR